MAIKVIARQTLQKIGKYVGTYRFVMQTQLYNSLSQAKVIKEASLRSGIQKGALNAAWDAIGEVIKAWATEGHSVAIPGLGSMRFSVRANSVANVEEVSSKLITSRRVIFTPSVDIKNELKQTGINITCFDKDGNLVKAVNSSDAGNVEDGEDENTGNGTDNQGGTDNGGTENQGGNTETPGGNDNPDGGIG
jgi:predicted histone-like DNA-binding protein